MKSIRQQQLSLRLRRSLLTLTMQSSEPVIYRIPSVFLIAVALLILLFIFVLSTRAAMVYRQQVQAYSARTIEIHRVVEQKSQLRKAALIDYRSKEKPEPELRPSLEPVKIQQPVVEKKVQPKFTASEPAFKVSAKIEIRTSQKTISEPHSVKRAFARLHHGRDQVAMRWLLSRSSEYRHSPAWLQFIQYAKSSQRAEHLFQLGLLYGAVGEDRLARQWLQRAAEAGDALYLRAYAVAVDRMGDYALALASYRRFQALYPEKVTADIAQRVIELELP